MAQGTRQGTCQNFRTQRFRFAVHVLNLSHRMYLLIRFRKANPPQNCQIIVYYD